MGRFRQVQTAGGQAALLFVAGGALGLLNQFLPGASRSASIRAVYAAATVVGLVVAGLPWARWRTSATLALVPLAFALIVAGRWYDPAGIETVYALWFVVVFGWIGSWHPARTALLVAPLAAVAYVLPFLPGSPVPSSESLTTVVIAIPIGVLLAEVLAAKTAAMARAQDKLEAAAALLERASHTDDLTGVGNRRRANALLESMQPGDGLVLLDLDHFKEVNDTLGHEEGDRVLMCLGTYLRGAVRDADCVARFGGEEFLILLRGAGDEVTLIVDRLLAGWRRSGCEVTLSAGVALHHTGQGPSATLRRADRLLYRAKSAGRDCAVSTLDEPIVVRGGDAGTTGLPSFPGG